MYFKLYLTFKVRPIPGGNYKPLCILMSFVALPIDFKDGHLTINGVGYSDATSLSISEDQSTPPTTPTKSECTDTNEEAALGMSLTHTMPLVITADTTG